MTGHFIVCGLGLGAALSASLLAAPTFVAAALSPDVVSAVVHDDRLLMLASQVIPPGLAGSRPSDLRGEKALWIVLRKVAPDGRYVAPPHDGGLAAGEQVIVLLSRRLTYPRRPK